MRLRFPIYFTKIPVLHYSRLWTYWRFLFNVGFQKCRLFFLCHSCTENAWIQYFTYFWCHAIATLNTAVVISPSGKSSRLHIAYIMTRHLSEGRASYLTRSTSLYCNLGSIPEGQHTSYIWAECLHTIRWLRLTKTTRNYFVKLFCGSRKCRLALLRKKTAKQGVSFDTDPDQSEPEVVSGNSSKGGTHFFLFKYKEDRS